MLLLGSVGGLGLGTLLIGELPRQPDQERSLITTALIVVGLAGGGLGLLFAEAAPWISADLRALADNLGSIALFSAGVSLTAAGLVLDQAVVGLLRSELQLWRNALHAVAKLGALITAGLWFVNRSGLTIYGTWVVGSLISLAALAGFAALRDGRVAAYRPQWGMLRKLGRAAMGHHALNLALQIPGLALPIVVTALLSARMNAYFYAAWMIASFAFVGPAALTTVLYAVGAAEPSVVAPKIRTTLKLSVVVGLATSAALFIGAGQVLGLFRAAYAEQAGWSLRILGLGVFPLIIKNHFVALRRIDGQVMNTALFMAAGGALELIMAATGASLGGLAGLSLGWVSAICIESLFMVRTVYRVAAPANLPAWWRKSELGGRFTR
jgi:O-antigen/teichoic acid export membrane protein